MTLTMRLIKPLRRYGLIALAALAIIAGTSFVWMAAFQDVLQKDAERTARGWQAYLGAAVDSLEDILAGGELTQRERAFFEEAQTVGKVFRYKLFDTTGRQRLISDDLDAVVNSPERLGEHNPEAAMVLATGRTFFEGGNGDGVSRPLSYTEVYVPLVREGRAIGTVEVYVDQTESSAVLAAALQDAFLKTLGILALGFAVPAGAYGWRSRQQARTARKLDFAARFDALTGTMNRASFRSHVEASLDRAWQNNQKVAVHFLDLDKFKDVNDTHGHAIGDAVLAMAADRLREAIGVEGELARLGGDEFAVSQTILGDEDEAGRLARRIVEALARPYAVGGAVLTIAGTIGYAVFPRHGNSVAKLLRAADIALYKAKHEGRGLALGFEPSMEAERQLRLDLEARLRAALADGEFALYFQPLYETASGALQGFEALLRLNDNDGKPITPDIFIPIAEEIGLIGDIGEWVVKEACRIAAEWPDNLIVAVNLSPVQFQDAAIVETVSRALAGSRLPARRLELEVTETILIANTERVLSVLRKLKSIGVSIALDDFGTGYSSLSYLWRFPFDKLKVDRSFMADLGNDGSKTMEVLNTIIALGKVLDLKVTAEGVETEEQVALLKRINCDLMQGYLLGRPMPVAEIAATILNDAKAALSGPRPVAGRRAPRKSAAPLRAARKASQV
ncbi:MAG: EAL domain-containing protein [Cucumibacter sp.]